MCTTRKAIVTYACDFLGNGCAQGMGQILNARNLHLGCTPEAGNFSECLPLIDQLKPREARFQKTTRSPNFVFAAPAAKF